MSDGKFKKGQSGNKNGRPKGVPNKSTNQAREAIARFVDDNSIKMQGWLDEIAADDPHKAFQCVKDLMEYHLPKLARTEQQQLGKDGEAVDPVTVIPIEIINSKKDIKE